MLRLLAYPTGGGGIIRGGGSGRAGIGRQAGTGQEGGGGRHPAFVRFGAPKSHGSRMLHLLAYPASGDGTIREGVSGRAGRPAAGAVAGGPRQTSC
eukprot:10092353-Karenia_brevis.AAC.1